MKLMTLINKKYLNIFLKSVGIIVATLLFFIFINKEKHVEKIKLKNVTPFSFYVWQRSWNSKLIQNIKDSKREFALLGAEFSTQYKHKNLQVIQIPNEILSLPRVTIVIRIGAEYLKNMPIEKTLKIINKWGVNRIQFDVDVPESKLGKYYHFLTAIKNKLSSKIELSVTALPSHLKHKKFWEITNIIDYYVLQVHGIDFPKKIDNKCAIIDEDVALDAIKKAENIGKKFIIALPSYGYLLCFDKKTGLFKKLAAENGNVCSLQKRYNVKLISPNLQSIRNVIKKYQDYHQFIWFRFPVVTDRYNYDLTSLEKLEKGESFAKKTTAIFKRFGANRLDLYLSNIGSMSIANLSINIDWNGQSSGEFSLFKGAINESKNQSYAVLPQKIIASMPPCGQTQKIASFYISPKKIPIVSIKHYNINIHEIKY